MNDPGLSLEEKVQQILMSVTDRIDGEIVNLMNDIEQQEKKGAGSKDKTGQGLEKLQLKLQQLMEKRKQMFQLMTDMSMKFNEMAKAAIQNMARA